MGAGISISKQQIINIIKRDLAKEYFSKIYDKNIKYEELPNENYYIDIIKRLDKL